MKTVRFSLLSMVLLLTVSARAQWTGTSMNLNYTDLANWAGNDINDTFTGNNWFSNQQFTTNINGRYFFTAGSNTVVTVPNAYATQVLVGQSITGDGIPDGTVVTSIIDNTSFTISNAATRTSYVTGTTTNDVYLSFNANATTINAVNNNVKQAFTVNQVLNGYAGIADGTVITAITANGNNSTLTLDRPTVTSDSLLLPQVNNYWNINTVNHTVKGNFTYISPDIANVSLTPDNGTVWTFTAPDARITVSMGNGKQNVARTFNFGSSNRTMSVNFSGGNPVFDINPTADGDGVDLFNLYATVTNAASLTRIGSGQLYFYRPVNVDGAVTISGMEYYKYKSTTVLEGTGVINADHVNILGARHILIMQPRNILSGTNMLADGMPVNIYTGALDFRAQEQVTAQTVGPVHIYGRAGIANASGNADNVTLTLSSLTREGFATVNLIGNNGSGRYLGNKSFIKISGNDQNIKDSLVGGKGADGTTKISIIPWASAQGGTGFGNADSSAWTGNDMVTYTTAGGFRALTAAEYYSGAFMSAAADDNVTISADTTVSADKTINALRVTGGNNLTIADGKTLTVTSGLIGAINLNNAGGTLNTGTNAAIFTMRRTSITITSDVTNDITDQNQAGFIAANADGLVTLQGTQKTYGGMTVVQTGLQANAAYVLPFSTELRIDRDGEALISYNNSIRKLSGVGWLTFNNNNIVLDVNANGPTALFRPGNREVRVGDGGILAPGDMSGDYRTGTLLLGTRQKNMDVAMLTLDTGGIFEVDISAVANDMVENDNYSLASTLNLQGGTISLNFLDGYTPIAGETDTTFTWTLTKGFDAVTGSVNNLTISDLAHPDWLDTSSGYGYGLSLSGADLILTLKLEAIPEPSTWLLLATGAGFLACLRRRR